MGGGIQIGENFEMNDKDSNKKNRLEETTDDELIIEIPLNNEQCDYNKPIKELLNYENKK